MIIDYSQLSTWNFCPWLWYERYVKGMALKYVRQRDDALALGSLVHNGLDNYSKIGKGLIDPATIQEINPTPECFATAELLVRGYLLKYPRERWPVERTEEPVRFPLVDDGIKPYRIEGVAKLDGYFYVPEDTTIESGLPGQTLTLSRGWWSREYKTKSPAVDRGTWIAEWASKRQADFQILALTDLLKNYPPFERRVVGKIDTVQGVLVSVLEKPREYIPKRKCKGCGETYPLEAFFVCVEGHRCPVCGNTQKLKPYIAKEAPIAEYYRLTITRTPGQLETARREITQVALAMEELRTRGMESLPPNRDNCITNRYHRKCEFAENHIAGRVVGEPEFAKVDAYKYIGL